MRPLSLLVLAAFALGAQAQATRTHLDDVFRSLGARDVRNDLGPYPFFRLPVAGKTLNFAGHAGSIWLRGETQRYPNGTGVGRVTSLAVTTNRMDFTEAERQKVSAVLWKVATTCFNVAGARRQAFDAAVVPSGYPAAPATRDFGPLRLVTKLEPQYDGRLVIVYTLSRAGTPGTGAWKNYCSVMLS